MQVQYPKFFDDYEEKQAIVPLLAALGRGALMYGGLALPYLRQAGSWLMSRAPQAAGAATNTAGRTWGQWGWNAAKNIAGTAGTMMAADIAMNAMGWGGGGGQQPGAQPNETASMALLQAAMNSPDPAHRQAAQQYLQQNFGFNPNSFQPQQPQHMGDMTLNGMMNMFGRQPNPQVSSPFFQGQQAQQQPRTVYVPLMPQQAAPAQAPAVAARPDPGQPPAPQAAPAQAPAVAARPAPAQPQAPQAPQAAPAQPQAAPAQPVAQRPAAPQPSGVNPVATARPPMNSIMTPPVKPLPAGLANMPTATAAAPVMPWFLRGKEAAAGGLPFFREDG